MTLTPILTVLKIDLNMIDAWDQADEIREDAPPVRVRRAVVEPLSTRFCRRSIVRTILFARSLIHVDFDT